MVAVAAICDSGSTLSEWDDLKQGTRQEDHYIFETEWCSTGWRGGGSVGVQIGR